MADTVQFLILPGILMFLHPAVHIVVNGTAGHDTGLAPSLHGEFIEVIILLRVSHIDPFLNLTIKHLPGLVIDTAVIGIHVIPKLSLSPVNVQAVLVSGIEPRAFFVEVIKAELARSERIS